MAKTLKIIKKTIKIIFANGSSTVMVLSIFFNYFCAVPIYKRRKKKIKSFKHCLPRASPAFLLWAACPRVFVVPVCDEGGGRRSHLFSGLDTVKRGMVN